MMKITQETPSQLQKFLVEASGVDTDGNTYTPPTIPSAPRAWVDIEASEEDVLIGPGRWLTVGSGCMLVAPTGAGKSPWSATQSFTWALGRPSIGFVPVRPLKSLVVQSEDDDGDLQRQIVAEYLVPWFEWTLKGRSEALVRFNALMASDPRLHSYQQEGCEPR